MEVKMPSLTKHQIEKLKDNQVTALKGHLMEIRKIGSKPIYVKVVTRDSVGMILKNADIPTSNGIKIEGTKNGQNNWVNVTLRSKAIQYSKIAVTTKVSGA